MSNINVKNNHEGTLNVAGVDIAPKATAAVDEKKLEMWMNGHAAKVWKEQGLIEFDADFSSDEDDNEPSEKEQLLERARELGLTPAGNTGVKKLKAMIEEAEAGSEGTSGEGSEDGGEGENGASEE